MFWEWDSSNDSQNCFTVAVIGNDILFLSSFTHIVFMQVAYNCEARIIVFTSVKEDPQASSVSSKVM